MSKYVSVPNGDYTVKTQSGGTIRLDTGSGAGETRVTGDLVIEGNTVNVSTVNLEISDNIIELNKGETGAGVGEGTSGIRIDRGTKEDALFLIDETIEHVNPNAPATEVFGTFVFRDAIGNNLGIRAPSIQTGGSSLYLDTNGETVKIVGSAVTYSNSIKNNDDDHALTNKLYVDEVIDATLNDLAIRKIADGNTQVEVTDASDISGQSRVDFMMDSSIISTFFPDRIELNDVRIKDQTISGTVSNGDLILEAPGTGTVRVKDVLNIATTPGTDDVAVDPLAPASTQYAILTLVVCNTAAEDLSGANDATFDLYIVPAVANPSGTGSIAVGAQTQIAKRVRVAGSDTFTFDTEKMVLGAGDRIILEGQAPYNLSATVSYLEV